MTWGEALLIIVAYCSSKFSNNPALMDQCRNQKVACVKRVTRETELKDPIAKVDREIYLFNGCLDDNNFTPVSLPKPPLSTPPKPVPVKKHELTQVPTAQPSGAPVK